MTDITLFILISLLCLFIGSTIYFYFKNIKDSKKLKRIDNIVNRGYRKGILNHYLTYTDPKTDEKHDLVITAEVVEKKKTDNSKTFVEVVSFTGSEGYFPENGPYIKRVNELCGGWVDTNKIEWLVEYDGREELINQILED